jgi:hypothetical protein
MKPTRMLTFVYVLATTVLAGLVLTVAANDGVEGVAKRANAALAAVSRAAKRIVARNVDATTGVGTTVGTGLHTAPAAPTTTTTMMATSAADPTESDRADTVALLPGDASILPADRATTWKPGMMGVGGIPVRSTVCAKLTPRGEGQDDRPQIQAAINTCPAGQVVQLAAGTFVINSGIVLVNKGITLRGAGPGQTTLAKTNGAQPYPAPVPGPRPSPLVLVGPALYGTGNSDTAGVVGSTNLTADAVKGTNTVTVESTTGFSAGQIVLLDEASGAGWQTDPRPPFNGVSLGQVWAAPDWRVVWRKHNPRDVHDDFDNATFPHTPGGPGQWFSRLDRPTAEVKQIASISGNTISFTTPFHISYRTSHAAQLSRYGQPHVLNAGVEDLKLIGGDADNILFNWAALSWAKNVESTVWLGTGFEINSSFRIELRKVYAHDAAWIQPGGGAYAIGMSFGTSEVLIEDSISVRANKVMVARCAGAGSVVGYNYMDMGYINYNGAWIEVGLNASHMVGPHHVLFEGNYGVNADSDSTHGASSYITFFRNHLRGVRAPFTNQQGGALVDDANQSGNGPKRTAGPQSYSYFFSFVGNVMGAPGKMAGWVYESTFTSSKPGIWMLGWDNTPDPQVASTTIRDGNWDFLTKSQHWHNTPGGFAIPNSLYLTSKPAFFGSNRWPWVDPTTGATYTLPAKARYDALAGN